MLCRAARPARRRAALTWMGLMLENDSDLAQQIRERPAIAVGPGGSETFVRDLALHLGALPGGTLSITLGADEAVSLRMSGNDNDDLAGLWERLRAVPDPPSLTGDPLGDAWAVARASSRATKASEHEDGFELSFTPDYEAIEALTSPNPHRLIGWLTDLATARAGLTVELVDEAAGFRFSTRFPGGAQDRLLAESGGRGLNHAPLVFQGRAAGVRFDAAFAWTHGPGLQVVAIVNGQRTASGGTHVEGVWQGLADGFNAELRRRGLVDRPLLGVLDMPRNCILVVSVDVKEPEWGPSTKDCLHSVEARRALRIGVARALVEQLGTDAMESPEAPWQQLGVFGPREGSWLLRAAEERPADIPADEKWGARDPYFNH